MKKVISLIRPLDSEAMDNCQFRLDNLTKPLGSLHALEHLAVKIAGITGNGKPEGLKKSIILVAADHGVVEEGISDYPQEVTAQTVANVCRGGAAINVFVLHAGASLVLVDIGVAADLPQMPGLRREKITCGTQNMVKGPALTCEQAIQAVETGIRIAKEELAKGVQVIGLGAMGIGNIISSTAIIACYSDLAVKELTGCGPGISEAMFKRKIEVVEQAFEINSPNPKAPMEVLTKVGGLEIAGLVGIILGAAAGRAAVVIDGIVTSAAALIAVKLAPQVKDYLVGSHYSVEPAHQEALRLIGTSAYLHLNMSLGEGTGAALGISLIDAGLHVLNDMKTFGEAEVAVAQDGPGALKQCKDVK